MSPISKENAFVSKEFSFESKECKAIFVVLSLGFALVMWRLQTREIGCLRKIEVSRLGGYWDRQ
ncbi:hypothetical protein DLM46_25185 [Paraburkholderia lacunae]|uniref:Uncharacterized protein n=1 Tax=Paraburkholderia lacunae TaxID=2211104 RepID=A0A370N2Z4_9BURK|nr:hypothetical protein DLM46_25185 [Paraburkholderia lacunae]